MRSKGSAHFSKVSSDATSVVLGSFVGAECNEVSEFSQQTDSD